MLNQTVYMLQFDSGPTRPDQALEVTVETRLALAYHSTPAFGWTVETRLITTDVTVFLSYRETFVGEV